MWQPTHIETKDVIVPVLQPEYEEIGRTFGIDSAVLDAIIAEEVTCTEFNAFVEGYGIMAILKRKHIVITYGPAAFTTYVLARVTCHHEAEVFADLLEKWHTETPLVTAILASWITEMLQPRARAMQDKKKKLLSIERETGLHSEFSDKHARLDRGELLTLVQQFMLLKNGADRTALKFLLDLLNSISDTRQGFALDCLASEFGPSKKLRDGLTQIRSQIDSSQTMREKVEQRADVLLQTTYILLAQRDHDVTVRIADATQKDAAAQKQIAERAYHDSANMKAMTLINLCCLPWILAATFFGAGFFNFNHNGSASIVSPWIWLYWATTAALTGLLWIAWTIAWHKTTQSLEQDGPVLSREKVVSNPSGAGHSTNSILSDDSAAATAAGDVELEDVSREGDGGDTGGGDADQPTWLPGKKVGLPLENGQCPICFVLPSAEMV